MSLEEELVNQLRGEGKSKEDIQKTCDDLVFEGYFNLDKEKIEVAFQRYDLLQRYNSRKGDGKKIKRDIERKLELKKNNIIKEQIKYLLKDAKIIPSSIKIKTKMKRSFRDRQIDYCNKCYNSLRVVSLNYLYFHTDELGIIKKKSKTDNIFNFCEKCGNFSFVRKM